MARKKSLNVIGLNAELSASDSAIDPLLEQANITSIKVEGRDVPAGDAPMPDKIRALAAVTNASNVNQDMSELIQSNEVVSRENDRLTVENARLSSANATLTGENSQLKSDKATLVAANSKLTADAGELGVRHEATLSQVTRVTGQMQTLNADISKACLKFNCLDLTDADGKALPKDATEAQKQVAADRLPANEKLSAIGGAVNAALAKTNVSVALLPAAGVTQTGTQQKAEPKGRERMKAGMTVEGKAVVATK